MKAKYTQGHVVPANSPIVPATNPIPDTWLDAVDLMQIFHISRRTIARWCNMGLVFSRIGNKRYFRQTEIDRFMKQNEVSDSR